MRKFPLYIFTVIVILPTLVFAGTSGKITGRITDESTGRPLPGANIIIEGTTMGAAADANGYYFIINVPPGTYVLKASMMGYTPMVKTNVVVNIDLTTRVNFKLSPTVLEAAKPITVVATRPMVELDVTSGSARISSREINELPSEEFHDILVKKAGITTGPGGEMHIRGGRSDEVVYMVDGVPIINPFTHEIAAYVPNNLIQQMEVVSGTFNAEYGNAMSGVVNIVTKEGGNKLAGTISAYAGDYLSNHTNIFWNIDDFNPFGISNFSPFDTRFNMKGISNLEGTFSGPIPFKNFRDKFNFFIAGKLLKDEGWLWGIRKYLTSDVADVILPLDSDTTAHGDNKFVPMNPNIERAIDSKLRFKITPSIKLAWAHFWRKRNYKLYSHTYTYNPDALYNRYIRSTQDIITFTHAISNNIFYNVGISYSFYNYEYYLYKDPGDPRYYWDTRYYSGIRYNRGGCPHGWFRRNSSTITSKFDITSQVNNTNLVKMGIEAKLHDLYYYYMWIEPASPYKPTHPLNWDEYRRYPREASAYIQDKIEFKYMVINVGIRFDYFDPRAEVPISDQDVRVISPGNLNPPPAKTRPATVKTKLSPRLGIAHPISDRGMIYFSYGHFFQMPTMGYLYANPEFEVRSQHNITTMGNADLKPQKTVIYEVGFKQQITNDVAFDLTAYYKDIRDLLTTRKTSANPPVDTDIYFKYINQDYGYVRGVTFALRKQPTHYLSASLDYTYQIAEANNSYPTTVYASQSGNVNIKRPNQVVPLHWDQRHTVNATVTLSDPGKWGISLIGSYGSGRPYTPTDAGGVRIGDEYSARKPAQYNFDLRAHIDYRIGSYKYSLFVKVYNLFDRLNENYVYNDTGRAGYTHIYDRYGGGLVDPGYSLRPNYYSRPRSVRFGITVSF